MRIPELTTERLVLRPLADEFTDFVFTQFSDPDVMRYLLDQAPLTERTGAERIVAFYVDPQQTTCCRWVLVSRITGEPVGTCGFHKWDRHHRRAEIGYDLAPSSWRQGLMSEALTAALAYGFEDMALHRVDALVHTENTASLGLLDRLGFENEGLLRDYYYLNAKYHDHYILSLLRPDWNTHGEQQLHCSLRPNR